MTKQTGCLGYSDSLTKTTGANNVAFCIDGSVGALKRQAVLSERKRILEGIKDRFQVKTELGIDEPTLSIVIEWLEEGTT